MSGQELGFRVVGRAGSLLLLGLGATLRFEVEGAEHYRVFRRSGRPLIFALWHSRLFPLLYVHRNQGVVALASRHRDGEYISRVLQGVGMGVSARGSSTRGGATGLRELLRAARSGRDLAITPDGPVGPARRLKMGSLAVARLGGLPIVPVTAGGSRVWRLGSWDRFLVPKPFARIRVLYGEPIEIARDASPEEMEEHRRGLESVLNAMTDEVDGVGGDAA